MIPWPLAEEAIPQPVLPADILQSVRNMSVVADQRDPLGPVQQGESELETLVLVRVKAVMEQEPNRRPARACGSVSRTSPNTSVRRLRSRGGTSHPLARSLSKASRLPSVPSRAFRSRALRIAVLPRPSWTPVSTTSSGRRARTTAYHPRRRPNRGTGFRSGREARRVAELGQELLVAVQFVDVRCNLLLGQSRHRRHVGDELVQVGDFVRQVRHLAVANEVSQRLARVRPNCGR